MEITLDKKNSTEGLIKIKLTEGDYQPHVEEKVKDYARKANIKGFRQGKVPSGVIRKMFGKSARLHPALSVQTVQRTFAEDHETPKGPLGDRRISLDKTDPILKLMLERMSIRSIQRITGAHQKTILDLLVIAGGNASGRLTRLTKRFFK